MIGLFPNLFFDKINPSAQAVADAVQPASARREHDVRQHDGSVGTT